MAGEDAAGLFGVAASSAQDAVPGKEKKEFKQRIMLRDQDSVAAQCFDPWGVSSIMEEPMKEVWTKAAEGNKFAVFHSELAAKEQHGGAYRVGIGVSRFAMVTLAAITELDKPKYAAIIKDELMLKAKTEAKALRPHLEKLDAGKGYLNQRVEKGFKRKAAGSDAKPAPADAEIRTASAAVHAWLALGMQSPLRGLLMILGGGGVYYAAHAADKTFRAWLLHGGGNAETMAEAAIARVSKKGVERAQSELEEASGLFAE